MVSVVRGGVRSGVTDPHAPRRRKRRSFALAAGLSETPSLIYCLRTLLC
jgi:hypothetical protein